MKKQKKFTSEGQIIKAIDDKKTQMAACLAHADRKQRRRAYLIEQKHLPALKRTLAAFRTDTMPFVEDKSVVLEK